MHAHSDACTGAWVLHAHAFVGGCTCAGRGTGVQACVGDVRKCIVWVGIWTLERACKCVEVCEDAFGGSDAVAAVACVCEHVGVLCKHGSGWVNACARAMVRAHKHVQV